MVGDAVPSEDSSLGWRVSQREHLMHFDETTVGDCRIFSGAIESAMGDGYIAALIVLHQQTRPHETRELFRDESLACGHRWESAEAALAYAMAKAREIVRRQEPLLAA